MSDRPALTVKVGGYSSVVGGGVHLHEADGRFAGQIMIACQTDTLRDKDLQQAMCNCIAKALTQFFGSDQPEEDEGDDLSTCEGCDSKIAEGAPYYYSGDGIYLCEDCAPMASDALRQMAEALKGEFDESGYSDFYETEEELRAAHDELAARVATKGDYKLVSGSTP